MLLSDKEFLETFKTVFHIFPYFFNSDVALGLTDLEQFILFRPAETFKIIIKEGSKLQVEEAKYGPAENAIITKQKQSMRYPKEAFGFPIMAYAIPVINDSTGNAVGAITFAISQEKEHQMLNMADELQAFARQLSASSQEFAGSSQVLAANSQEMCSRVNTINNEMKKLDELIDYIKYIAEQSNLLGLNAAIESARSGESGRGFSVIAEEIRKLANNSKSSSVQIVDNIKNIRNEINNIYGDISGFAAISEEQAAHTEQIAAGSQRLSDLSSELLEFAKRLQA